MTKTIDIVIDIDINTYTYIYYVMSSPRSTPVLRRPLPSTCSSFFDPKTY